jgi:K+-transporting ATPase ATPase C chain
MEPQTPPARESTLNSLGTAALYTVVSVALFGFLYPLVMWGLATLIFPHQAGGSLIVEGGKVVGSELVGQRFAAPKYFHGRPSAAGKGYDPTSTDGTNFGPTSKKLIDQTKAAIVALRKENPGQVPRVAKARALSPDVVRAIVAAHIIPRQLGFLGEEHVNVLALNRALDAQQRGAAR